MFFVSAVHCTSAAAARRPRKLISSYPFESDEQGPLGLQQSLRLATHAGFDISQGLPHRICSTGHVTVPGGVGARVGLVLGSSVGNSVGALVGRSDGTVDGEAVGLNVGTGVGGAVGGVRSHQGRLGFTSQSMHSGAVGVASQFSHHSGLGFASHSRHHGSIGYRKQNSSQSGVGFVMQSLHCGRNGVTTQRHSDTQGVSSQLSSVGAGVRGAAVLPSGAGVTGA